MKKESSNSNPFLVQDPIATPDRGRSRGIVRQSSSFLRSLSKRSHSRGRRSLSRGKRSLSRGRRDSDTESNLQSPRTPDPGHNGRPAPLTKGGSFFQKTKTPGTIKKGATQFFQKQKNKSINVKKMISQAKFAKLATNRTLAQEPDSSAQHKSSLGVFNGMDDEALQELVSATLFPEEEREDCTCAFACLAQTEGGISDEKGLYGTVQMRLAEENHVTVFCLTVEPNEDDNFVPEAYHYSLQYTMEGELVKTNCYYMYDLQAVAASREEVFDFTLEFVDADVTWSTLSETARDECLWNVLKIYQIYVDSNLPHQENLSLDNLNLSAAAQNFISKNKVLQAHILSSQAFPDEDYGTESNAGSPLYRVEDSMAEATDAEKYLNSQNWKELKTSEIDLSFTEELNRLEQETIEQLIGWETPHPSDPQAGSHHTRTMKLVDCLEKLDRELREMSEYLSCCGEPLKQTSFDMKTIQEENDRLEMQFENGKKLEELMGKMLTPLVVGPDQLDLLKNPSQHMMHEDGIRQLSQAVFDLVQAIDTNSNTLESCEGMHLEMTIRKNGDSLASYANDFLGRLADCLKTFIYENLQKNKSFFQNIQGNASRTPFGKNTRRRRDSNAPEETSTVLQQNAFDMQSNMHEAMRDYGAVFNAIRNFDYAQIDIILKVWAETLEMELWPNVVSGYLTHLPDLIYSSSTSDLASQQRYILGGHAIGLPAGLHASTIPTTLRNVVQFAISLILREKDFFMSFFGLSSIDHHKCIVRSVKKEFTPFQSRIQSIIDGITDGCEYLAVLVELNDLQEYHSSELNFIEECILCGVRTAIGEKFSQYCDRQSSYVIREISRFDGKNVGVLAPFAQFPALVNRLQASTLSQEIPEATKAFINISTTLFQELDKLADNNSKYKDVIRLENYYFYVQAVEPLGVECLDQKVQKAKQEYEESSQRYLEWLISYEFPELTKFFQKIKDLVEQVGSAEARDVQYHESWSSFQNVMMKYSLRVITEGIQNTYKRMSKHLCKEADLLPHLWSQMTILLFTTFSNYEELTQQVYNHTFQPSALQIKQEAEKIKLRD